MVTVTGTALKRATFTVTDDPLAGDRSEGVEVRSGVAYSSGTGVGQVNAVARIVHTIPAGSTLQIDLQDIPQSAFAYEGAVSFSLLRELVAVNLESASGRYVLWGTAGPADASGYSTRLDPGGSTQVSSPADGYLITQGNRYLFAANPHASPVTIEVLLAGVGTYSDT